MDLDLDLEFELLLLGEDAAASFLGVQEKGDSFLTDSSWAFWLNASGLICMLLANSVMLKFMPFNVLRVINCTSNACTLAATALLFCSSQNITVLSSWILFSISAGSSVGAIQ